MYHSKAYSYSMINVLSKSYIHTPHIVICILLFQGSVFFFLLLLGRTVRAYTSRIYYDPHISIEFQKKDPLRKRF